MYQNTHSVEWLKPLWKNKVEGINLLNFKKYLSIETKSVCVTGKEIDIWTHRTENSKVIPHKYNQHLETRPLGQKHSVG